MKQEDSIPYGYCHCGCGEKTKLVQKDEPRAGRVKGEPNRYLQGHQRKNLPLNHGSRRTYGVHGCRCDACVEAARSHTREWIRKNPERAAQIRRKTMLKMRYGLTPEDYDRIHESQFGRCAICDREKPLDVDHCHDTGQVRGLLCRRCNLSIGRFNHNPEVLHRAAEYLENYGLPPGIRTQDVHEAENSDCPEGG